MLASSVIIVHDDPAMQVRLRSILLVALGLVDQDVVFARRSEEACRLVAQHSFSLALVDMDSGEMETVQRLHQQNVALPIIVLSRWNSGQTLLAALKAGAVGYLLKERDDVEIALSIRNALRGGCPIDPFVTLHILEMARREASVALPDLAGAPPLSPREMEVLHLVAKGFANREVSNLLHLSVLTVECHMKNIYRKLEVKSRTQAVFEARAFGLLP